VIQNQTENKIRGFPYFQNVVRPVLIRGKNEQRLKYENNPSIRFTAGYLCMPPYRLRYEQTDAHFGQTRK
jgi:hypothetical protein